MALHGEWIRMGETIVQICSARGFEDVQLTVTPPATEDEVASIERQLGRVLPASFRAVLLDVASAFELRWSLPDGLETPFDDVFSGAVGWSLTELIALETSRREWIQGAFPSATDPYDRIWHDKLAVAQVANGDLIALDVTLDPAPLVYLSHDDGRGHGHVLGLDFQDAITRWLRLGGVGNEDWQWLPFVDGPTGGLQPDGESGRRWRDWLGLPGL